MPHLNFISSGRSVRKRLPLEKFVDYTHCCESSISLEGGRSKDPSSLFNGNYYPSKYKY